MKRRTFLQSSAALAAMAAAPAVLTATPSFAATGTMYTPGHVQKELDAGKTVFVDFWTGWCVTCRAQGRAISAILSDNPAYEDNISFVVVDWDQYANSELSKRLNIPRRSTLVVLKGDQELGRLVARTSKRDIKALLDTALEAATA